MISERASGIGRTNKTMLGKIFTFTFLIFFQNFLLMPSFAKSLDRELVMQLANTDQFERLNQYLWKIEKDVPIARYLLGMASYHGHGTFQDHAAAAELFSEAWNEGFAEAGAAYCILIVQEQLTLNEYIKCLTQVAETGNATAKEALAGILMLNKSEQSNLGINLDQMELLNEAYAAGSGSAAFTLFLLSNGMEVGAEFSQQQIAYLEQAANSFWLGSLYGNSDFKDTANLFLAVAHLKGNGVDANVDKYITFLQVSYALGNADAACRLGQAYTLGAGVEQDFDQAENYLKIGKSRGCNNSSLYLSELEKLGRKISNFNNFTPPAPKIEVSSFYVPENSQTAGPSVESKNTFRSYNETLSSNEKSARSFEIFGTPGISCRGYGNITNCSNGTYYQHIGNFAYGSNGRSYQKIGKFVYRDDGNSYQTIGRTTYGSDGSYCRTYGRVTSCF